MTAALRFKEDGFSVKILTKQNHDQSNLTNIYRKILLINNIIKKTDLIC